jgi:hypothetical protein
VRWAEYAEMSRQLAEVRGQETARQSQAERGAAAGRAAMEKLELRLTAQRAQIADVAMRLRESKPSLDGAARTGLTDPDEAIRRAAQAIEQADVEVRQAEERGTRPLLFPTMSAKGRNALVYSVAAFGMWLVSCGFYSFSSESGSGSVGLLLWSIFGLPAIAFFAGHVVISIAGRPRVQPLGQVDHSNRLGGLMCFGGMALGWILFLAATALL